MVNEHGTGLYRAIKWLWLALQALILPLAALHAVSPAISWPILLPAPLFFFGAAVFLVLWLIAQSLLAMARFPLTLKEGALLVGGTLAQTAFQAASGSSLTEAAYAVFFATQAALAALVVIMTLYAFRRRLGPIQARLAALLALAPALALTWFLATPLRPVFSRLAAWRTALDWLMLALNSGLIVISLWRFSIFAPIPENDIAYTREWERWAAPTIIILILSAVAAVLLAGIFRRA